jgi:hypothetical protein
VIRLETVRQTVRLSGTDNPVMRVSTPPAQAIRIESAGVQGPRGRQGEQGPIGQQGEPGIAQLPPVINGGFF